MLQRADVADQAADDDVLTDYDMEHLVVYLRLIDAEKAGAPWQEGCTVAVLGKHPTADSISQAPEAVDFSSKSNLDGRRALCATVGYKVHVCAIR